MYYPYQQPNFWEGLASGLLSGLTKKQEENQDKKDTQSFMNMMSYNPEINTNDVVDQANFQLPKQGLLSRSVQNRLFNKVSDNWLNQTQYMNPNASQTFNQSPTEQTNNQQITQQPNITQRQQTWADVQNNFNSQWAKEMKARLSGMSADSLRQYMPQLMAMRKDNLAQLKSDWDKKEYNRNLDAFFAAPDYKSKMMMGLKAGMKPDLLKLALDNGMTFHNLNLTDRQQPIAYDKFNNQVINLLTGQPVTAEELQNGVNPTAIYNKNTVGADTIYNKNTVGADTIYRVQNAPQRGYGGGGGGGGRSGGGKLSKAENWASTYENNGLNRDNATIEAYYDREDLTPAQQKSLNQALANRDRYWQISSGGSYGNDEQTTSNNSGGSAADYNQEWQSLVDGGFTPDEAYQYMSEKYGGQ